MTLSVFGALADGDGDVCALGNGLTAVGVGNDVSCFDLVAVFFHDDRVQADLRNEVGAFLTGEDTDVRYLNAFAQAAFYLDLCTFVKGIADLGDNGVDRARGVLLGISLALNDQLQS